MLTCSLPDQSMRRLYMVNTENLIDFPLTSKYTHSTQLVNKIPLQITYFLKIFQTFLSSHTLSLYIRNSLLRLYRLFTVRAFSSNSTVSLYSIFFHIFSPKRGSFRQQSANFSTTVVSFFPIKSCFFLLEIAPQIFDEQRDDDGFIPTPKFLS